MAYPETFGTGNDYREEIRSRAYAPDTSPSAQPVETSSPVQATQTATQTPSSAPQEAAASLSSPGGSNPSGGTSTPPEKLTMGIYGGGPEPGSFQGIFDTIGSGVKKNSQDLGGILESFNTQAGQHRTFESAGGTSLLDAALQAGANDQATASAKGLLGASYTGPTALQADDVGGRIADIGTRAKGLSSIPGLQSLFAERAPSLTPGQARQEANTLLSDPGYRRAAQGEGAQAAQLLADYTRSVKEAPLLAGARKSEEDAIRQASTGYLTGKKQGVLSDIDALVAKDAAQQQGAEAELQRAQTTGDVGAISAANRAGWDESTIAGTPGNQALSEGKALLGQIAQKYQAIAQVPLLVPRINSHGREVLDLPDDYWKAHQGDHTGAEWKTIKDQARARQEELAKGGFSMRQSGFNTPTHKGQWEGQIAGPGGQLATDVPDPEYANYGRYAAALPMDFGGDLGAYTPPDATKFMTFDPGVSPSRGNVSTSEQKRLVDRINTLLDVQTKDIPDSQEAFRAAAVKLDIDNYLAEEQRVLEQRKGTLTQRDKDWFDAVVRARAKYKESDDSLLNGLLGSIGFLAGPVGGATLGGALALSGPDNINGAAFEPGFARTGTIPGG